MPYFDVRFERTESVDIVVEARNEDELQLAVEAQAGNGFQDWAMDEGEWEVSMSPCGPKYDPKADEADGSLHGLDLSDPETPKIVAHCDRKGPPPETDEERAAREYREAEAAGQQALTI